MAFSVEEAVLAARQPPSEPVCKKPTTKSEYLQEGAQARPFEVGAPVATGDTGPAAGVGVAAGAPHAVSTMERTVKMPKRPNSFFFIFLSLSGCYDVCCECL